MTFPTKSSSADALLGDPGLPAQIYGTTSCGYCHRALRLLQARQIACTFVDLDEQPTPALRARLMRETGQGTVPYVFLRGEFVGGCDELYALGDDGELEARVQPQHA